MGVIRGDVNSSPVGRLAHYAYTWGKITKDQWVLSTIKGYRMEFLATPFQSIRPHPPRFNKGQLVLVEQEVQKLQDKGAVVQLEEVPSNAFLSNLFLVPKKDGGQRPVINLKQLNTFVVSPHFKMEGIQTFKSLVKRDDWLVKVDLKDAYFSVPIDRSHRQYLCFPLGERIYQFTCLPFGLTSAPWVFTKTLKPVTALRRELGFCLVIYIDDILLMAESKALAQEQGEALVHLLECLGFTINKEKTVMTPSQTVEFLGFNVNTQTMEMNLPALKLKTIRAESRKLLREGQISARALSRLTDLHFGRFWL